MFINRSKYKPCFECKGTATKNNEICKKCGGYGSIGLKVVMQGLRKTNKGKSNG